MPRNIDLFIASDAPLDELAAAVAGRTGTTVDPRSPDGAMLLRRDATVAALAEHSHPDAGDLRLSRYRYVLSAVTEAPDHLSDTPEARLLRAAASALAGDFDVLLVLDLQNRPPVATG